MKKTLIALIIFTLSIGVVGCTSDKEETTSNTNEVVTQEESKEEDKRSSDEMYELYISKLDEVEKLFKENNLDFKEKNDDKNKKYDEKVSITYEDSNKDSVGEIPVALYGLSFEDNGDISFIASKITLNVNGDEIKNKEFKFEDTEFYKLTNILIPDIGNEEEINKKVNDYYKNDGASIEVIDIENGKIKQSIAVTQSYIDYIITINP
ncbi:hypothetical protein [Clostridium sp.]|uniref:hypothetical protein n=1 Tax=Clostridium sp. TaxID=1506 RepID=UPI0025B9D6F9|nr:hypothetical protein [Clostridium sp.]